MDAPGAQNNVEKPEHEPFGLDVFGRQALAADPLGESREQSRDRSGFVVRKAAGDAHVRSAATCLTGPGAPPQRCGRRPSVPEFVVSASATEPGMIAGRCGERRKITGAFWR
jgi:hypothetical protein